MLNLITDKEMREADVYTCEHSGISSTELMEQAAKAFTDIFVTDISSIRHITVIAGTGNNGGDGLAIARLLRIKGYRNIQVICLDDFANASEDFTINKERLHFLKIPFETARTPEQLPQHFDVVIDAVLGSGLNRELSSFLKNSFAHINKNSQYTVSVDIPSGCAEDRFTFKNYEGIRADLTICFQRPKLLFTLPESYVVTKAFKFTEIGLDETYLTAISTDYYWTDETAVRKLIHKREAFTHKGTYGHVLVVSGNTQTKGASLLTAKAALFSGAGLVTLLTEADYFPYVNIYQPELMTADRDNLKILDYAKYQCIATGPGMGTDSDQRQQLLFLLQQHQQMVLDADALNLLTTDLLKQYIKQPVILTPHVKEFDRLFGSHANWYDRIKTAKEKAKELHCVIVLKNQYTYIFNEEGKVFINATGNPAMAQGGMGDVLTGCITGFLARGYSAFYAAVVGCFVHGKAGNELAESYEVTPASIVAEQIPLTVRRLLSGGKA